MEGDKNASVSRNKNNLLTIAERLVGFTPTDLLSWTKFVKLLHRPSDPSSLAIVRILFGSLMIIDVIDERGFSNADIRWGDPKECHFPLFNFLKPLPLQWMCIIYLIMWIGAFGIMLGYHFTLSCIAFVLPYWYILLLDKTSWNNHSYLYGLLAILFLGSHANNYFSLDSLFGRIKSDLPVPLWNYAVLRFQLFILYFFAGLKKLDRDWIEGYSMTNLSHHWVFDPLKLILTPEQIDFWIVHFIGFLLDLTIGFWLFFDITRPYALFFCSSFHLMNSRMFTIGMFPYVCLATMPIFCHTDWPKNFFRKVEPANKVSQEEQTKSEKISATTCYNSTDLSWKHHLTGILLLTHASAQVFLPYSHFLTKGYNNWTNGLYGYSWDMMVHSWDTVLIVVKVVDNDSGREHFLDPEAWVQSDRWAKHADMVVQYAHCLKRNLLEESQRYAGNKKFNSKSYIQGNNISIYLDVWCSLNGRFQQRMFDPRVDILEAHWSPFEEISWLMPLLTEFSTWRTQIMQLEKEVLSWSNYSDSLFVADFPGLTLENYINPELKNVSLTVLEGNVVIHIKEGTTHHKRSVAMGQSLTIPSGRFHEVETVSPTPACLMYTYTNHTKSTLQYEQQETSYIDKTILNETYVLIDSFKRAVTLVSNAILNVLFSIPMVRRVRVG